jgi:hypothetical protein
VTQSIYIETATDNPPWIVVLFSGDSGALYLSADGPSAFRGNFLVRTAGYWVGKGDAAVLYDTPAGYAAGVNDTFRFSEDAITDLKVAIGELRRRFPSSRIALSGASRGTVSVGNAIEHAPTVADAFVLTSPVSVARGRGVGLSGLDVDGSKERVRWSRTSTTPARCRRFGAESGWPNTITSISSPSIQRRTAAFRPIAANTRRMASLGSSTGYWTTSIAG